MYSVKDYSDLIAQILFDKGIIDKDVYLKCSTPSYIADLSGDLRTTDIDVLEERMNEIEDEILRREDILAKAEYRIGVKKRDIDRLVKRLDKHNEKMDKATDSINGESDKIVKGIDKLEKKLDKINFDDKSLADTVQSRLDKFKKAHNDFFEMELTGKNTTGYKSALDTLKARSTDLHNILTDLFNGGMIGKGDLNNGDISKNIDRISKNIDKFVKAGNDYNKDSQKIQDNIVDVNYIAQESVTVENEIMVLNDNYDKTLTQYLDNGGNRDVKPGFNQEGHGTRIPDFIDEMDKLQNQLRKENR